MDLTPRQKKVYQEQDVILSALRKIKPFPFVLSGGTALSRFYFHHRFSEDLDFFCEKTSWSFERIEWIINQLRKTGITCEMTGRTDQADRLKAVSYTVSHKLPIKVDFLEDPFSGMWKPVSRKTESGISFRVDVLDQIYYRKFFSLLEQWHRAKQINRVKDLVDLYCLHEYHRSLEKTVAMLRKEHIPVDEEKIIMILGSLQKKDIQRGLKNLSSSVEAEQVWKTIQTCSKNLLKEGLGR